MRRKDMKDHEKQSDMCSCGHIRLLHLARCKGKKCDCKEFKLIRRKENE
jgi:hypothetical protein